MWELDHKEGWTSKNWCFQTVVLEKTLESPLESKEIKPVNPKGNQSWIFIGRADPELKLQDFGHLMRSSYSLEKNLRLGKIETTERRRWQRMWWLDVITDSMGMSLNKLQDRDAWHPWCDGQGSLACCSSWGCKESDMTEWMNWTELMYLYSLKLYTTSFF